MKALFHGRNGKAPPAEALTPTSHQKQRPPHRGTKENVDPGSTGSPAENASLRMPSAGGRPPLAPKARSPLHPRPSPNTGDAPLKNKKLSMEALPEDWEPAAVAVDSGVQVIVRMRPLSKEEEGEGEQIVQKISSNSVSIVDHTFTFDSVADTRSTQEDIFQLVGLPLVENCLAGFNSSIFAYGQTGSGKTYTMWGPPSALLENGSPNAERGLTPRVFELLFSRISEEQMKHSNEQRTYQCRCSFLEIYNEQIMDLLDPSQKNLQIREDVRTGVYVDCLSEEYVCTMKDVIQLLTKGLANRRIGATSINAESSRSHCVFTCVVESHSKNIADGLNSLRMSRINLVDLAGSERQKLTGAAGERLKEAGNINRSLSQLGNLINILAEVSQSGKQRHIPYRDSKLTFLLQESLGGNAKLAMICAISPSQSCKNETLSTLRFAQRAKAIKNKAVVNEITQDDVNVLREQIRQLKDELLRMKSNGISAATNGSYSTAWNARRSLNLLRMSLGHPTVVPGNIVDDENDEEMEIDEGDVQRPSTQSGLQSTANEENVTDVHKTPAGQVDSEESCLVNNDEKTAYEQSCELVVSAEGCELSDMALNVASHMFDGANDSYGRDSNGEKLTKNEESGEEKSMAQQGRTSNRCKILGEENSACLDTNFEENSTSHSILDSCNNSLLKSLQSDLSIVPCDPSPNLLSPTLSISPKVDNNSKESHMMSASTSVTLKDPLEAVKPSSEDINFSFPQVKGDKVKSSIAPTDNLAASLHRGLQIIDGHQQKSPVGRSSCRFSFKPVDFKSFLPIAKADIGTQTVPHESEALEDPPPFICSYCKNRVPPLEHEYATDNKQEQLMPPDVTDKTDLQLIPADVTENKEMQQLLHVDATDNKELQIVLADVTYNKELQLVPTDESQSSAKSKKQVPKAVEKVLAGAIRREMALEDHCSKQMAEIIQLKRLIQQYKHERECNALIGQTHEEKIWRLESLMDGILPSEDFMEEEFMSLANEHKLLKEKYDNHPEVLRVNIELKRVQDELETYRNFFHLGEREVLLEEIQDLRNQLQCYIDSSPMPACRRSSLLQLTHTTEPVLAPLKSMPESASECDDKKFEEERRRWTETESKWISLSEELRLELEASRSLAEKLKMELHSEKKCSEELKEALQTAMQGHARILDQYADLHEKHIALLARHQQIREGIDDVKRAAVKAGVRGAESKFINSLAAQISALKVEREKERRYWKEENKGLQAQLRDTAEAVQAAGELLVRLKEAEEAAAIAQKRTTAAEKEAETAYREIDNLKKKHKREIDTLNQFLAESRLPKEAWKPPYSDAEMAKYDATDRQWREEFETIYRQDSELSRGSEQSSWFSGYDRCNI